MYKNILIPIDIAEESSWQKALPVAIDQARRSAGMLHVIAVAPEVPPQLAFLPSDYGSKMRAHATEKLASLVKAQVPDDTPVQQHVGQGSVYKEILKAAREINADLIVMASHRPEFESYFIGPNAARVVRHADCSVLVVR
jgi:nucleotide-binding universal stress UspA family protein